MNTISPIIRIDDALYEVICECQCEKTDLSEISQEISGMRTQIFSELNNLNFFSGAIIYFSSVLIVLGIIFALFLRKK